MRRTHGHHQTTHIVVSNPVPTQTTVVVSNPIPVPTHHHVHSAGPTPPYNLYGHNPNGFLYHPPHGHQHSHQPSSTHTHTHGPS